MIARHTELLIPDDNPFLNCKLQRKGYGEILSTIVSSYSEGFVLAINNEWGTGKSTFINMWQKQLSNLGYKTLHFNAWESDFNCDPLVAIMSEFKSLIPEDETPVYKSLLKKGAVLTKSILPTLAKALAEKYIDTKLIVDAIEDITKASTEIFKEEIDEYTKKKIGLLEFKRELEKFISENSNGKPLILIIDELDRCRPNYAVEVLEKIKHFFSVKGIIFVLSIDKIQLCNSIKGYYGSHELNAEEYLRRFIDIEYSLPPPNRGLYSEYLYNYFGFDDFFNSPNAGQFKFFIENKGDFLIFAGVLFENEKFTLRQQEKLYAYLRIILQGFKTDRFEFPMLYLFLIFLKITNTEFYNTLINKSLTCQEILDKLEVKYCKNKGKDFSNYFVFIETLLVWLYNLTLPDSRPDSLVNKDRVYGVVSLNINSNITIIDANSLILSHLQKIESNYFTRLNLEEILKRINLTENFGL